MSEKYLNITGLEYLWSQLKTTFVNKSESVPYYKLATNHPSQETVTVSSLYNTLNNTFGTTSIIINVVNYYDHVGFISFTYYGVYDVEFLDFKTLTFFSLSAVSGDTKISELFESGVSVLSEENGIKYLNLLSSADTYVDLVLDKVGEVSNNGTNKATKPFYCKTAINGIVDNYLMVVYQNPDTSNYYYEAFRPIEGIWYKSEEVSLNSKLPAAASVLYRISDLSTVKSDLSTLSSNFRSLSASLASVPSQISSLTTKVNNIEGNYVDLTSDQTIEGYKCFNGDITSYGREIILGPSDNLVVQEGNIILNGVNIPEGANNMEVPDSFVIKTNDGSSAISFSDWDDCVTLISADNKIRLSNNIENSAQIGDAHSIVFPSVSSDSLYSYNLPAKSGTISLITKKRFFDIKSWKQMKLIGTDRVDVLVTVSYMKKSAGSVLPKPFGTKYGNSLSITSITHSDENSDGLIDIPEWFGNEVLFGGAGVTYDGKHGCKDFQDFFRNEYGLNISIFNKRYSPKTPVYVYYTTGSDTTCHDIFGQDNTNLTINNYIKHKCKLVESSGYKFRVMKFMFKFVNNYTETVTGQTPTGQDITYWEGDMSNLWLEVYIYNIPDNGELGFNTFVVTFTPRRF